MFYRGLSLIYVVLLLEMKVVLLKPIYMKEWLFGNFGVCQCGFVNLPKNDVLSDSLYFHQKPLMHAGPSFIRLHRKGTSSVPVVLFIT
jgi:hypothetical protein